MSVLVALLAAGCASGDGGGIGGDPEPSAKLTVTIDPLEGPIDEKSALNYVRGTITLTGTVTVSNGELDRVFIDEKNLAAPVEVAASAGTENEDGALVYPFSIDVDTTATYLKDPEDPNEEPRRVWPDGKRKIKVAAESTSGRRGNSTFEAIIDNTVPVLTCTGPVAQSAHVGDVNLQCCVEEENLSAVPVFISVDGGPVDQANPAMVLTEDDLDFNRCFSKPFDRGLQPTAEIDFNLGIADSAGNQALVTIADVRILRPPAFDGIKQNRTYIDNEAQPQDMDVGDIDGDGLIDVLVVTGQGARAYWGTADEATGKHTGTFPEYTVVSADDARWVLLRDVDKDGNDDVVLATKGTLDSYIEVWISRGREFMRLERLKLDHTPDPNGPEVRHEVSVITDADFDADGGLDYAIGGKALKEGLVVVHGLPTPLCTVQVGETVQEGPCGQVPDLKIIKSGKVFDRLERYYGVTDVTAISAGRFFSNSDALDIVVAREGLSDGVLSVCRNKGGKEGFASCQNVTIPGAEPIAAVAAVDYGSPQNLAATDTIDDLITFSTELTLRWTRTRGDGQFDNVYVDPNGGDRYVEFGYIGWLEEQGVQIRVEDVNIGGERWAFLPAGGPFVPRFPIDPTNNEVFEGCFTNFVFGTQVIDIALRDIDGENEFDMIVLDLGREVFPENLEEDDLTGRPSIATFLSDGKGGYKTTKAYGMCHTMPDGFVRGTALSTFQVADFNGDLYPDLVTFGHDIDEGSEFQGPAIPVNVRTGDQNGGGLIDKTRNGYLAPHDTWNDSTGGPGGADVKADDASWVAPTASASGNLDGDNRADVVLTLDQSYTLGEDEASGDSEVCPPCVAVEWHEVDNAFGVDNFEPEEGEGGVPQCCVNFTTPDEGGTPEIPATGYGGGSPIVRTSALVLTALPTSGAGSGTAIFGLTTSNDVTNPARITPNYAMAAGIRPRDVALADFNNDGLTDMATLMGAAPEAKFCKARLHPRVRLFLGDGLGKFTPYFLFPQSHNPLCQLAPGGFPNFNQTGGSLSAGSTNSKTVANELLDGYVCVEEIEGETIEYTGLYHPTYLYTGVDPVQLQTASFCGEQLPSLFSLNRSNGDISVLRNGWFDVPQRPLQRGKEHAVGTQVQAMSVQDVNSDQCNDLVVAMSSSHGIVPGTSDVEQYETQNLETFPLDAVPVAITVVDVNNDGYLDRITADTDNEVRFYLGDGRGGFVSAQTYLPLAEAPIEVRDVDLDLDGCRDLQIGGATRVSLLRNEACDALPAP